MKKAVLIIVIALAGIGIFSYPFIANYLSEKNSSYAADQYALSVNEISEEDLKDAWEQADIYNENLAGNPVHDPFVEGSGMVMGDNYYEILSIEDTMGVITIPKIDVKLSIYHGTADSVLQNGVGHLEGSSMPVGGKGTHSVVTGHTGLTHAKLFTDLVELKEGDQFFLQILDKTLAYEVDNIAIVEPYDTEALKRVEGEDYCTLVTCTPYGINSHRLLVRGKAVPYVPELEEQEAQAAQKKLTKEQKALIIAIVTTSAVMAVIIIGVILWTKGQAKKARLEKIRREMGMR